ncbi:MAG TPA: Spy/CpxP family protein refolding chaperone [Blastocatellia bacterium]|nr:Spy/CpxP family protein refolding chaperone [Blastocatellia bacterium]
MPVAVAIPIALAQSSGTNQGQTKEPGAARRERGGHHGRHGDWMPGGFARGLNLTDAQKAQMKQLSQSFRERTQPLRNELRAKHEALREASQGSTFNEALATQKLTEMAAVEAKLMGERFRMRQEMLALLTPEQKTQLEQFRAKHGQFRHGRPESRAPQSQ